MLRVFNALKVTFTFFCQCKRTAVRRKKGEKKKKLQKEFQENTNATKENTDK